MKVYIFYHICTHGPFADVIREMMELCKETGVFKDIDTLFFCVVGDDIHTVNSIMEKYPKTKLLTWGGQASVAQYERFTLHAMQSYFAKKSEADDDVSFVLYTHSKGVSERSRKNRNVPFWRRTMIHALLAYREFCWTKLFYEGYDAVSLFSRRSPSFHFSGNMWWSTSDYIRRLPKPIGSAYLDPEMWIGRNITNSICLYPGPHNLYHVRCPTIPEYQGRINLSQRHTGCQGKSVPDVSSSFIWENDVVSVECGIADEWYLCERPACLDGKAAVLDVFPFVEGKTIADKFVGRVKQFRFCYNNPRHPQQHVTLMEGMIIRRPPPDKTVYIDAVSKCHIVTNQNPQKYDATGDIKWSLLKYTSCALTNAWIGHDPFPGIRKRIVFYFDNGGAETSFDENTRVYFV